MGIVRLNERQRNDDAHAGRDRCLREDDLRRHLNGQREIVLTPKTIVTPLAARSAAKPGSIAVRREEQASRQSIAIAGWGYAEETPSPLVAAAVKALGERRHSRCNACGTLQGAGRKLAEFDREGKRRSIVFCEDPALVCCLANKVGGLRAAAVEHGEAGRHGLRQIAGPNLLAVEMPGRTFFEIRQIIQQAVQPAACPDLAGTLQELDGHAHR